MNIIQAFILGVVEGVTEFLPVSSTGHLILAAHIMGLAPTEYLKSFEIAIQLGAIAAIVIMYRKRLITDWEGWKRMVAAMIPTGILGLLLYKVVKTVLLGNAWVVVISLLVGGVIIIAAEKWGKFGGEVDDYGILTYRRAFWVGVGQSLAMIPGVSRSAATIITGRMVGMSRRGAVEFSFLLAIPTMILATGLDLFKSQWAFSRQEWLLMGVGMAAALITALVVVKWFLSFVQNKPFTGFGVYRIVGAILFWLIYLR